MWFVATAAFEVRLGVAVLLLLQPLAGSILRCGPFSSVGEQKVEVLVPVPSDLRA